MSATRKYSAYLASALLAIAFAGCGSNGRDSVAVDLDDSGNPTESSKEVLRNHIREMIVEARKQADESGADMREYKPYFFKEFTDYPDGPDDFDIEFVESESRVVPMTANVQIKQLRFVTDVKRNRAEARTDSDFMRQTGTETINYELRNGRWYRTASLFVADNVQYMVNGVWEDMPPQPRDPELSATQERPGFFRRAFGRFRLGENRDGPE